MESWRLREGEKEQTKERKSALTPDGLHRPPVKHSLNNTADFTAFASTVRHTPLTPPCSCASCCIYSTICLHVRVFWWAISRAHVPILILSEWCWSYKWCLFKMQFLGGQDKTGKSKEEKTFCMCVVEYAASGYKMLVRHGENHKSQTQDVFFSSLKSKG